MSPSPQRPRVSKLGSMATSTGREAMDPNVRWDRREGGKEGASLSNSVRKGKARRALARPAGGATRREAT